MKVGTRKYEFSSEAPWLVNANIVQQRTRSRVTAGDMSTTSWVENDLSAAEVLGAAADTVSPENEEGLKAIGEHPETQHRNLERRSRLAARARGLTSPSSERHWRQTYMRPLIRHTAKELYRLIHYSERSTVGAPTIHERSSRTRNVLPGSR